MVKDQKAFFVVEEKIVMRETVVVAQEYAHIADKHVRQTSGLRCYQFSSQWKLLNSYVETELIVQVAAKYLTC